MGFCLRNINVQRISSRLTPASGISESTRLQRYATIMGRTPKCSPKQRKNTFLLSHGMIFHLLPTNASTVAGSTNILVCGRENGRWRLCRRLLIRFFEHRYVFLCAGVLLYSFPRTRAFVLHEKYFSGNEKSTYCCSKNDIRMLPVVSNIALQCSTKSKAIVLH